MTILEVIFTLGKEAEKLRQSSPQQIEVKRQFYSRIAGSKLFLKINRLLFNLSFVVFGALFWLIVVYISWLPAGKAVGVLSEIPYAALFFGSIIWGLSFGFIIWGLFAEDSKLANKLLTPLDKWDLNLKEKELAAKKVEAIDVLINDIQNDS